MPSSNRWPRKKNPASTTRGNVPGFCQPCRQKRCPGPCLTFYNFKEAGITASLSYGQAEDSKQTVVAFDILLDDLFQEIQRVVPSQNSRVFFRQDAMLYMPESKDSTPDFKSMGEVKDLLIQKMVASWTAEKKDAGFVFSVAHDEGIWWGGFRPLE